MAELVVTSGTHAIFGLSSVQSVLRSCRAILQLNTEPIKLVLNLICLVAVIN